MKNRVSKPAFYILLALYVASILTLKVFPTQDGPALLYNAQAFKSFIGGNTPYHSYYSLYHTFGTHVFFLYLLTALSMASGMVLAEKLLVVIYVVGFVCGFRYLAQSAGAEESYTIGLFAFPFTLNQCLLLGFYDFSLSVAMAMFVCGWWLRCYDRLTILRSTITILSILLLFGMHPIATFVVLLFIAIHLLVCFASEMQSSHASLVSVKTILADKLWKPLSLSVFTALMVLVGTPMGKAKTASGSAASNLGKRLLELATLRPLSPFEPRLYRGLLIVTVLVALVIAADGFARNRRTLSRSQLTLAITAVVSLIAYSTVPGVLVGGAYFPQRFAVFGVLLLMQAALLFYNAGSARLMPVMGFVGITTVFVISISTLAYEMNTARAQSQAWGPLLDTAADPAARLGVIVEESGGDSALTFDSQMWTGAHYLRRSDTAMLNGPFENNAWIFARNWQPCQLLNPQPMADCLLEAARNGNGPPVDLVIGERERPSDSKMEKTERIAAAYGLTKRLVSTPLLSVFARAEHGTPD